MNCFPDTSFLCAVYRTQVNSPQADVFMSQRSGPLPVSSLLLLEFRQSTRLQVKPAPVDWAVVHQLAEDLSARYTACDANGHFKLNHVHSGSYQVRLMLRRNGQQLLETIASTDSLRIVVDESTTSKTLDLGTVPISLSMRP